LLFTVTVDVTPDQTVPLPTADTFEDR